MQFGQLAQLVEHILDVDGARGSSPLLPNLITIKNHQWIFLLVVFN